MKIRLNTVITGMGKKPFKDIEGKDMTVRSAMLYAIVSSSPAQTPSPSTDEVLKLRQLFDKIENAENEVDLGNEELLQIKEMAAARLTPFLAGSLIVLLVE